MRSHFIAAMVILGLLMLPTLVYGGSFSYGLKGGISINDEDFGDIYMARIDKADAVGWALSLQLERPLSSRYSLRADVGFLEKGFNSDSRSIQGSKPVRIDYLSFDLLSKALVLPGVYLLAGPRLDLKIDMHDKSNLLVPAVKDNLKRSVIGATLGLGTDIPWTAVGFVFLEFHYNFDLTPVYKRTLTPEYSFRYPRSINNQAAAFTIGIRR